MDGISEKAVEIFFFLSDKHNQFLISEKAMDFFFNLTDISSSPGFAIY